MDVPPDQLQAESLEACLPILRGLDEVPKIIEKKSGDDFSWEKMGIYNINLLEIMVYIYMYIYNLRYTYI